MGRGGAISRQTLVSIKRELFLTACTSHRFLVVPTMAEKSQRPKGRDSDLPSLDITIGALNRAKEATSITPAMAAFTSAGVLLTTIRVGSLPDRVFRLPADVYRTRWPTKRAISN